MNLPLNLTVIRYLALIAVGMITVALLAVVAILLLRGVPVTSSALTGLITYLATLVGLIVALAGTGAVANAAGDIQQKLNGHLEQHIGHTDAQVNALIDARLAQVRAAASPLEDMPAKEHQPPC